MTDNISNANPVKMNPSQLSKECAAFKANRKPKALTRKQKDSIYADLGLTKVRGAKGGIYYE